MAIHGWKHPMFVHLTTRTVAHIPLVWSMSVELGALILSLEAMGGLWMSRYSRCMNGFFRVQRALILTFFLVTNATYVFGLMCYFEW